jgi:hypothetical protein
LETPLYLQKNINQSSEHIAVISTGCTGDHSGDLSVPYHEASTLIDVSNENVLDCLQSKPSKILTATIPARTQSSFLIAKKPTTNLLSMSTRSLNISTREASLPAKDKVKEVKTDFLRK